MIEQARFSAWASNLAEEQFKDKLKRLVSYLCLDLTLSPITMCFQFSMSLPLVRVFFGSSHLFFFIQGFKYYTISPNQAVLVMLRAEKRLGRKFTVEEIEAGEVGPLLIESDFETDKMVSSYVDLL